MIDTATNTVVGYPIPIGGASQSIVASASGHRLYVIAVDPDPYAGTVSVIDTATNTVAGPTISVGTFPSAAVLDTHLEIVRRVFS